MFQKMDNAAPKPKYVVDLLLSFVFFQSCMICIRHRLWNPKGGGGAKLPPFFDKESHSINIENIEAKHFFCWFSPFYFS